MATIQKNETSEGLLSTKHILITLYNMKKEGTFFTEIDGKAYSADELLSFAYGRPISYEQAEAFMLA